MILIPNKDRGSRYERIAKKELERQGYMVVRSGSSLGVFDLWAYNQNELKLIQCKATKSNVKFNDVREELKKIKVPAFCSKELWIWIDRKGWKKEIII